MTTPNFLFDSSIMRRKKLLVLINDTTKAAMPADTDAHLLSQPIQQPEESQPQDSSSASPSLAPQSQDSLSAPTPPDFVQILFFTNKWPGWAIVLLGGIICIPDWQSRLAFWISTLQVIGGQAHTIVNALPVIGKGCIVSGAVFIAATVWQESIKPAWRWVPLAGWTIFIGLLLTFGSVGLFAQFVTTSRIPQLVAYFERQSRVRTLNTDQKRALRDGILAVKSDIIPFEIQSGRDPETFSYAKELLDILKQSGLQIVTEGHEEVFPVLTDIPSLNWVGIIIFVRFPDAPPRAAILLSKVLNNSGLTSNYGTMISASPESFYMVVGLK